ncbi:kinase-like domain-containing protein [Xylaria grammica]|nr:kinase-like domain-containing protein [Xylaria grammica]
MEVGGWRLRGHHQEAERLLVQVEVDGSLWFNIIVEQPTNTPDNTAGNAWRAQLSSWFLHRTEVPTSQAQASDTLVRRVLAWCNDHYQHVLPQFGNSLFLDDIAVDGSPIVTEKMDLAIINALPTVHSLFGGTVTELPIVLKAELCVQAIEGTFFLPQTRPVSYNGNILVAKGPASAARAIEDLREAVHLWTLQSRCPHPNIIPPPTALVRLSNDDERICGFLIPFYQNGNLDSYARKLRQADKLTSDILWAWFRQLVSAAKFLMDAGTWHGDIKPDNILVNSSRAIVLIDLASKYTTVSIASPEVIKVAKERGSLELPSDWPLAAIEKSEVYSIGRTLFLVAESIAMDDIYTNPGISQASQTFFTETSLTPVDLREVIQACVRDDPSQRPSLQELFDI